MRHPPSLRALAADQRGAGTVFTALAFTAVLGFVALGLNAATGLQTKRRLQMASDAAAQGGALAIRAGLNPVATANGLALANLDGLAASVRIEHPPANGPKAGDVRAIRVEIARTEPVLLGVLLGAAESLVRAGAVGELRILGPACVLALAGTAPLAGQGLAQLSACIPLSAEDGLSPARLAAANPYPSVGGSAPACTPGRLTVSGAVTWTDANPPPSRCGGIRIAAGGIVRVTAAQFRLGGPLDVMAGGVLQTVGTTILAYGQALRFHPGAVVDLSPPASGTLAGISIAAAAGAPPAEARLAAGATQSLRGAVLLPSRHVELGGNVAPCTQVIASRVTFLGLTPLGLACGATPVRTIADRTVALAQ
jgi:hypothetical protein